VWNCYAAAAWADATSVAKEPRIL